MFIKATYHVISAKAAHSHYASYNAFHHQVIEYGREQNFLHLAMIDKTLPHDVPYCNDFSHF